jgi:hypothetical protein
MPIAEFETIEWLDYRVKGELPWTFLNNVPVGIVDDFIS